MDASYSFFLFYLFFTWGFTIFFSHCLAYGLFLFIFLYLLGSLGVSGLFFGGIHDVAGLQDLVDRPAPPNDEVKATWKDLLGPWLWGEESRHGPQFRHLTELTPFILA